MDTIMTKQEYRICTRGVWDTTVPGITFDENGVSNYAKMFDKLCEAYPRGAKGKKYWENIVERIREKGKNKRYDCIIGVSGGTDSSYLLHLAKKKYELRPLAVNLDNGWNSDIAVENIKKVTKELEIDLETYVIDYEEVKSVLKSYMKAVLPWIDGPTDIAIKSVLNLIAKRENIKYILNGSDFHSEGKQPSEWTYTDSKQLKWLNKKFGDIRLKTFPSQDLFGILYTSLFNQIKSYRPLNYVDYQKKKAQDLLANNYDWKYYGGHHHENIFTKFAISYWLPKKFNFDKRKITLSAQILSGEITREETLNKIKLPPYDLDQMERDKNYVIKKLGFSKTEFDEIWARENKFYWSYPSYMPLYYKFNKYLRPISKRIFTFTPSIIVEKENRNLQ